MTTTAKAGAQVVIVGPLYPPPHIGGMEVQIQYLLDSQLARRLGMRLFNTGRHVDPRRRLYEKLGYQLRSCLSFAGTLRRERPLVVHIMAASRLHFYQHAIYALIARCFGQKVLMQIHGADFKEFYAEAGFVGKAVIRTLLRLPHTLLALSNGWASYLERISGRQVVPVVPNGLQVNAFSCADADRGRFGIKPGRIAILFMGGRTQQILSNKGFPELVLAIAAARHRCPALLLVVAGPECDVDLLTRVLGPQHDAWVALGPVYGETKTQIYRSVDIFTLPSRFENMPNTIMEAMAAGLPIVATPVGAIPEMIERDRNGFLVEVGDVSGLAAKLELLARDAVLRAVMGAHSLKLARRNFDFGAIEQLLLDEYRRLTPLEMRQTQQSGRSFDTDSPTCAPVHTPR
jgi:glycosyltransferase involved in cell wall biosynthesis